MCRRLLITGDALAWADPGSWRPDAVTLRNFFLVAQTESAPTLEQAERSLARLGGGCYTGQGPWERPVHWCGIFACAVWRAAGVAGVRWSTWQGQLVGAVKHPYSNGLAPGDIAVIGQNSHHFIVVAVDHANNELRTVEGNTMNQYIRERRRPIVSSVAGQSVVAHYRVPG
jgi:hypothetical protein